MSDITPSERALFEEFIPSTRAAAIYLIIEFSIRGIRICEEEECYEECVQALNSALRFLFTEEELADACLANKAQSSL